MQINQYIKLFLLTKATITRNWRGQAEAIVTHDWRGQKGAIVTRDWRGQNEAIVTRYCRGQKEAIVTRNWRGQKEAIVTRYCRGQGEAIVSRDCQGQTEANVTHECWGQLWNVTRSHGHWFAGDKTMFNHYKCETTARISALFCKVLGGQTCTSDILYINMNWPKALHMGQKVFQCLSC